MKKDEVKSAEVKNPKTPSMPSVINEINKNIQDIKA